MTSRIVFVGNLDSLLFKQRLVRISDQLAARSVSVINTSRRGFGGVLRFLMTAAWSVVRTILSPVSTMLVFHGAYSPVLWPLALLSRVRIISILQGSELTVDFRGVRASIIKLILTHSALVVCRNEAQRSEAVRLCGLDQKKCLIVSWGLNPELFCTPRAAVGSKIVMISPRATQGEYNIPVIFRAVERLKAMGVPLHFIYVKFNARFEVAGSAVVDECLVEPSQPALWQAIARSDLSISVPSYDGLSNTLLETLALGAFPVFSDLAPYVFLKEDVRLGHPVRLQGMARSDEDELVAVLENTVEKIDAVRNGVEFRRHYANEHFKAGRGVEELIEALRD